MKKILNFIIIPGTILIIWFIMTATFLSFSKFGFTSISYKHLQKNATNLRNATLIPGAVISSKIQSYDNNLGIVTINFVQSLDQKTLDKNDILLFRIKQLGQKDWYQSTTYPVGYVNNGTPFPFGFPIITDSKGKTFVIELSLQSTKDNLKLIIMDELPVLTSIYTFDKQKILSNPVSFFSFFKSKYLAAFQYQTIYVTIFAFALPIILILLYKLVTNHFIMPKLSNFIKKIVSILEKNIKFTKKLTQITFFSILISSSFVEIPILIYITIIVIWILSIYFNKLDSNSSYIAALTIFFVVPFLIVLNREAQAEKIAFWVYIFLVIGTSQRLIEQNYQLISPAVEFINKLVHKK